MSWSAEVCGKWILAGEHAVLRGIPALVFPLRVKTLKISYEDFKNDELELVTQGESSQEIRMLFWGVLDRAERFLGFHRRDLTGVVRLENTLPIGAGLGASATLCVSVCRWLVHLGFLKEADIYPTACHLENLFHGESSGVDIAVTLSGRGLHFERNGESRPLRPSWQPQWCLSYSGKRGVTSECVTRVKNLFVTHAGEAAELDERMRRAVSLCEKALSLPAESGFPLLAEAVNQAGICFERWGLVEGAVKAHIESLRSLGAVAVKPTGSGDGGYVLSLWREKPPGDLDLIPLPLE